MKLLPIRILPRVNMNHKIKFLLFIPLFAFTVPGVTLADCKSKVKGTTALSCGINPRGKAKKLEILSSGETKKPTFTEIKKSLSQDSKRLGKDTRMLRDLAELLDNAESVPTAPETLRGAESTLEDFSDPSNALEGVELEKLSNEELKVLEKQLREDLQKVTRDNKKIRKDFQKKSLSEISFKKKLKNFCKKKNRLHPQVCTSELICDDGVDEDQDGATDCDDSDCDGNDSCPCMEGEHAAAFNFQSGSFPNCGCYSFAFVQWSKALSQGATGVTALYTNSMGGQVTVSATEPYSNEHPLQVGQEPLFAPNGTNWIFGAYSTGFDSNLERCSPTCKDVSGLVSNPRVVVDCGG